MTETALAHSAALASGNPPDDLLSYVKSQMYEPRYGNYA